MVRAAFVSEQGALSMAWSDLGNIWSTFRELDIRPIREEAERAVVLAVVGAAGVGKTTLINAMGHDSRAHDKIVSPTIEVNLDAADSIGSADLVILVLDATQTDYTAEADLYRGWKKANINVLVYYNKIDAVRVGNALGTGAWPWSGSVLALGSALDPASLLTDFVPKVLELLPARHLSVARHFPLFRLPVSRGLIADTSVANATYSLGSGLAETIPALDIPFNVADIVVLTKNQALMVYKLGLALGLPGRWQSHVTELGGVVGAGFMWRQVARQLIGLVPVWGIIPKVAVAYAGTYAVGQAVLYWYQTGHKVSAAGMRQFYADALAQGRQVAQNLIARTPRPALPRVSLPARSAGRLKDVCPNCGRENPPDARFCAYCGTPLST